MKTPRTLSLAAVLFVVDGLFAGCGHKGGDGHYHGKGKPTVKTTATVRGRNRPPVLRSRRARASCSLTKLASAPASRTRI